MKGFILLSLLLFITASSFAGERGGNGGDGIIIDGKLYLLDLVEAGVEDAPYFDPRFTGSEDHLKRINNVFYQGNAPVELIARKLAEINHYSPILSYALMRTLELYNWRFVKAGLIDIKDENTVLDTNLKQLAIRRQKTIYIDKELWQQLDPENQTALIFHELFYAIITPKKAGEFFEQESYRAREMVGAFFSKFVYVRGKAGLERLMGEEFLYDFLSVGLEGDDYYNKPGSEVIFYNPYIELYSFHPVSFVRTADSFSAFVDQDPVNERWATNSFYDKSIRKFCLATPAGDTVAIDMKAKEMGMELGTYQTGLETTEIHARPVSRGEGRFKAVRTFVKGDDCEVKVREMMLEEFASTKKLFKITDKPSDDE